MSLVLSNPTPGPGLHALIVGVSAYPHLEGGSGKRAKETFRLPQLSCAALTALNVFEWLTTHQHLLPLPLKTCRLLLSPSPGELAAHPFPAAYGAPTLDDVLKAAQEWRDDASGDQDNTTLFYFAGHGMQRTGDDAIALLEDFADDVGAVSLRKAISTRSIVDGMVPTETYPDIARTQLYFVDACRVEEEEHRDFWRREPSNVFDAEYGLAKNKRAVAAPIYFATGPGTPAFGRSVGMTIFGEAVLHCLNGGAGVQPEDDGDQWRVSISSLAQALELQMQETIGDKQQFVQGGTWREFNTVITFLDHVPDVDVVVQVDPDDAAATVAIEARDPALPTRVLPTPLSPHPYRDRWPPGFYTFTASSGGKVRTSRQQPVMPPVFKKKVKAP